MFSFLKSNIIHKINIYFFFCFQPTYDIVVKNEDGRDKNFLVTIKKANELDLSWLQNVRPGLQDDEKCQASLQALDVILRSAPALQATAVSTI